MKKILLTGGNGFISKNIKEILHSKYEIHSFNSIELNLLDTEKVHKEIKNNKYDVVIHGATYDAASKYTGKDPQKVYEYNTKMFFNLARCQDYFGKMIYFGSGAEFSREHWIPMMKESYFGTHIPTDPYGLSKYEMTKYTLNTKNIYNLRLFAVFGKYEDYRYRFISQALMHVVRNKSIEINQNVRFDFLYIDDLVKIVDWFINNKPKHQVYNVCSSLVFELKEIAIKILKVSGKNFPIEIKKEGLGKEYSGDNCLIKTEITDFKLTDMGDAIRELLNYFEIDKSKIL